MLAQSGCISHTFQGKHTGTIWMGLTHVPRKAHWHNLNRSHTHSKESTLTQFGWVSQMFQGKQTGTIWMGLTDVPRKAHWHNLDGSHRRSLRDV